MIYPEETIRKVIDVDLMAPAYWVLEMTARIAEDRHRRGLGRWNGRAEEVSVCFLISDSAVGGELWCDAGWQPAAQ